LPKPAAPVILNNTPLVALWVLGRLDLLRDLYGAVTIPTAVRDEFLAIERDGREAALAEAPWIKTATLRHPQRALVYTGLDEGEAEVLALAEETGGLVVMDERKGRRYAQRLGLSLTGSLGILLFAKERGLVSSVADALTALRAAGLWVDPSLVAETLRLAGETA
jgi:predicted nucleic acid-binding protein